MFYCKHCRNFELCKHHGKTVDFAVDDGVCLHFVKDPRVQTNADRIRAMSDVELRNFLQSLVWICEKHKDCEGCPMYHEEKGCLSTLEWLKQPAEVEE